MKNKKLLAVVFMTVVCLATICFMSISANAAVSTIDTISEGEVWRESWTADAGSAYVDLEIDHSGLYDFTVCDYSQAGVFSIDIYDFTYDSEMNYSTYVSTIYVTSIAQAPHTQSFILREGHSYGLVCRYFNKTTNEVMGADLSIVFNENEGDITELPNCSLNASRLSASFTDGDRNLWVKFTTSEAGDYSLNFADLYATVYVYNASTAERVHEPVETEYMVESYDYYVKSCLVFALESNTEYYIHISAYENSTTKLSMSKNDKNVVNIIPDEQIYTIDSFTSTWAINYLYFSYKIEYSDSTYETQSGKNLLYRGYNCPSPYYVGETVWINDKHYLKAGEQPVETTYNGVTTTTYIYVQSLTEYFSYLNVTNEDVRRTIEYEGDGYYQYYWRVKVSNSGWYGIYRNNTDDFSTNFDTYSITIVDDQNNVIEFNDDFRAWNLTANEEYVLCFYYQYDPNYSYNDITFWLKKQDVAEGWTNENGKWAYYENGVKLANQWKKDSTGWCYLGSDGYMVTNAWLKDSKGWCYVGSDGYCATNCWKKDSIGWIWLDSEGSMTKSKWILDGGKWYYLDENGYMVSNQWRKDSKGWCWLTASGAMATNQWVKDSKGWCYIEADGYCATNCWKKDSIGWIWLDSEGSMTKNNWILDGGKWYYLDSNGYMVTGKKLIGGTYYTFNSSGVWVG